MPNTSITLGHWPRKETQNYSKSKKRRRKTVKESISIDKKYSHGMSSQEIHHDMQHK
jgi:hypothetical protein